MRKVWLVIIMPSGNYARKINEVDFTEESEPFIQNGDPIILADSLSDLKRIGLQEDDFELTEEDEYE